MKRFQYSTPKENAKRFAAWRELKREKDAERRWEKFLLDRQEWDEAVQDTLDVYEQMMNNLNQ